MPIPSNFMKRPSSVFRMPSKFEHNRDGFEFLVGIHRKTENFFQNNVVIDMSGTIRFDGDMCAMFGALLYRLGDRLNNIILTNISNSIKRYSFNKRLFKSLWA